LRSLKHRVLNISQAEKAAERLATQDGNVKLIAMKRRSDGLYDTYMQSFNNKPAAERAAESLRRDGYSVGVVSVEITHEEARIETKTSIRREGA